MGRVRGKSRAEERRAEERRSEKRKSQKKEDPGAPKLCVFPMICGSRGSKSRLAKAAGAEPAGQMRDEELHAVVARSTFRSQNVQSTRSGPLLEVEMSKKRTPLWRKAHMLKTPGVRTIFGLSDIVLRGRRKGLWTLSKVSKT